MFTTFQKLLPPLLCLLAFAGCESADNENITSDPLATNETLSQILQSRDTGQSENDATNNDQASQDQADNTNSQFAPETVNTASDDSSISVVTNITSPDGVAAVQILNNPSEPEQEQTLDAQNNNDPVETGLSDAQTLAAFSVGQWQMQLSSQYTNDNNTIKNQTDTEIVVIESQAGLTFGVCSQDVNNPGHIEYFKANIPALQNQVAHTNNAQANGTHPAQCEKPTISRRFNGSTEIIVRIECSATQFEETRFNLISPYPRLSAARVDINSASQGTIKTNSSQNRDEGCAIVQKKQIIAKADGSTTTSRLGMIMTQTNQGQIKFNLSATNIIEPGEYPLSSQPPTGQYEGQSSVVFLQRAAKNQADALDIANSGSIEYFSPDPTLNATMQRGSFNYEGVAGDAVTGTWIISL